jgi:methylated-DNA-[protein]-cysteine S-methyltransferase
MNELRGLIDPSTADGRAGHANETLRAAAERAGTVDVATGVVDSPIGELFVAVTPRGLLHVGFAEEDHDEAERRIAASVSPRILRGARATDDVRRELGEYFDGRRRRFSVRVDRRLMTAFARDVLSATAKIAYGRVLTYGDIAARIERPKAARAVGAALGGNPIPIVVPCHRVIGASGALTGYTGGLQRKTYLLELEGALPGPDA